MAAATVDTMLQSNGFQTKKKEDVDNKDNLWYVLVVRLTLAAYRSAISRSWPIRSALRVTANERLSHGTSRCVRKIRSRPRPRLIPPSISMLLYASQVVNSGGGAEQRQQQAAVEQKRSRSR